jgi:hypothetical protein
MLGNKSINPSYKIGDRTLQRDLLAEQAALVVSGVLENNIYSK